MSDFQNKKLSPKQKIVLTVIMRGDADGNDVDLDQLLESIKKEGGPYGESGTTKQSLQFTIRSLCERGYIVKSGPVNRRGKNRQTYKPTASLYDYTSDQVSLDLVNQAPAAV